MKKNGFTLIEVLISGLILAIIGVILADILARTFKSNDQVQRLSVVKDNGQVTMNIIDSTIRASSDVYCTSNGQTSTSIVVQIGKGPGAKYSRIWFVNEVGTTINGKAYIKDYPSIPTFPSDCTNDSGQKLLNNPDTIKGVSITNGQFSYTVSGSNQKIVRIKFDAKPGVGSAPQAIDTVPFETTVQLR